MVKPTSNLGGERTEIRKANPPTCFIIWLTKDKEDPDTGNCVGRDLLPGVLRKREKVTGRNPRIMLRICENKWSTTNITIRRNNICFRGKQSVNSYRKICIRFRCIFKNVYNSKSLFYSLSN